MFGNRNYPNTFRSRRTKPINRQRLVIYAILRRFWIALVICFAAFSTGATQNLPSPFGHIRIDKAGPNLRHHDFAAAFFSSVCLQFLHRKKARTERLGGNISLESQSGNGTTITICLPVHTELPNGSNQYDSGIFSRFGVYIDWSGLLFVYTRIRES